MECVAITGATGMIGRSLIDYLTERQVKTILFVRPGSKRLRGLRENALCTIVPCELADLGKMAQEVESGTRFSVNRSRPIDAFFHLGWSGAMGAGRNDEDLQFRNIEATLNAVALASALKCSVFVGAGSQAEFGRVEGIASPSILPKPETAYGAAKLAAGHLSRIACERVGIRHVWTRIFSVYGPFDNDRTLVSTIIRELLEGRKPSLTPGEQMWDYLYSRDAARALVCVAKRGHAGEVYCIGSGTAVPLRVYAEIIRDAIDSNATLGLGDLSYTDRQVMHLCADISTLTRDTGFFPEISFDEGIRHTIAWIRKNRVENEEGME